MLWIRKRKTGHPFSVLWYCYLCYNTVIEFKHEVGTGMKFQKKIIMVYMIFSIIVTGVFGTVYYIMNIRQYRVREYDDIRAISDVKMEKMEDLFEGMSSVITYFLSDVSVLEALQEFSRLDADSYEELYYDDAVSTIRIKLSTYYLINEYYRVVVFNKKGNVLSNTNYAGTALDENASYVSYPWKDKVSGKGGRDVILGLHTDDWGKQEHVEVLSVVKEIQGMDMGYIEVQQDKSTIDEMLSDSEEKNRYIFLSGDGEVIYTNDETLDAAYIYDQMEEGGSDIAEIRTEEDSTLLCLKKYSDTQDMILLTLTDTDVNMRAMREVLPVSIVILLGALTLSLSYIYLTSRQLTRPIRQLQKFMETTRLDNMNAEIPEKISNDEIESLYISYRDVLERLRQSMVNEKRMSLLQLQAQFDLLQAQVNPHFIYNVLNVISNRGIMSDDEVICEICGELAAMLRYATNTKEKYATVKDEIQYMDQYLHLLKYRYDYRLSYSINIDERLYKKILPKIVLQQIVENAVWHGYEKSKDRIEIEVRGWKEETGWYLRIHDNGCGISAEKQRELDGQMESVRKKLTRDRTNVELEIGGMGLVNTYARLYLLYDGDLIFEIMSENGTDVVIGVKGAGADV